MKRGIAIVKSIANKSGCNSFGDRKRHKLTNTAKVTNVKKTDMSHSFLHSNAQQWKNTFRCLCDTAGSLVG